MYKKDMKKIIGKSYNIFYRGSSLSKEDKKLIIQLESLYNNLNNQKTTFDHEKKEYLSLVNEIQEKKPNIIENSFFCIKGSDTQGYNLFFALNKRSDDFSLNVLKELIKKRLLKVSSNISLDDRLGNYGKGFSITISNLKFEELAILQIEKAKKEEILSDFYIEATQTLFIGKNKEFIKILELLDKKKPFANINKKNQNLFFSSLYSKVILNYSKEIKEIENKLPNIFSFYDYKDPDFLKNFFTSLVENNEISEDEEIEPLLKNQPMDIFFVSYKNMNKEDMGLFVLLEIFPKIFDKFYENPSFQNLIVENIEKIKEIAKEQYQHEVLYPIAPLMEKTEINKNIGDSKKRKRSLSL